MMPEAAQRVRLLALFAVACTEHCGRTIDIFPAGRTAMNGRCSFVRTGVLTDARCEAFRKEELREASYAHPVIALALTFINAGSALAGGDELETPGEPNCQGQSVAVLAQASKNGLIEDAPGLGNLSFDRSVSTTQEGIRAFCAGDSRAPRAQPHRNKRSRDEARDRLPVPVPPTGSGQVVTEAPSHEAR